MATSTTPKSTYMTFLMTSSDGTTWEKLVDIKDFPDMGGSPDRIQVTTLSDRAHKYTKGIEDTSEITFTANYIKADHDKIYAMDDGTNHHFALWLGGTESGETVTPNGEDGKFTFDGQISVYLTGAGVGDAKDMTITITPSTKVLPNVSSGE